MIDPRVVALVAAHDEAARIGATVRALRAIPEISLVVVADDGSSDDTTAEARAAGATVLRATRRSGKGGALEGALQRLSPADVWLLADADLEGTAGELRAVLMEVLQGRADLAIAAPPPQAGGGFGLVRWAAASAIRRACGFQAEAPLSGQRALTATALERCRPLASGFGVETALTIDAVRAGLRVAEISANIRHRSTGRGLRGFVHRGRQGVDIVVAAMKSGRR